MLAPHSQQRSRDATKCGYTIGVLAEATSDCRKRSPPPFGVEAERRRADLSLSSTSAICNKAARDDGYQKACDRLRSSPPGHHRPRRARHSPTARQREKRTRSSSNAQQTPP